MRLSSGCGPRSTSEPTRRAFGQGTRTGHSGGAPIVSRGVVPPPDWLNPKESPRGWGPPSGPQPETRLTPQLRNGRNHCSRTVRRVPEPALRNAAAVVFLGTDSSPWRPLVPPASGSGCRSQPRRHHGRRRVPSPQRGPAARRPGSRSAAANAVPDRGSATGVGPQGSELPGWCPRERRPPGSPPA